MKHKDYKMGRKAVGTGKTRNKCRQGEVVKIVGRKKDIEIPQISGWSTRTIKNNPDDFWMNMTYKV